MGSIYDHLAGDADHAIFAALAAEAEALTGYPVAAMLAAGPPGGLTAFLPDDAALMAFAAGLGYDGSDPARATELIVAAFNASGGSEGAALLDFVGNHFSLGVTAEAALPGNITTTTGALSWTGSALVDADPDTPDAHIVAADIGADNGIIHDIDQVLLPFDLEVTVIDGSDSGKKMVGTAGIDVIYGNGGSDTILADAGDDRIYGGSGKDKIHAGDGNDLVQGGSGDDHIYGGLGADSLYGDAGNDHIYGGDGSDVINGGNANDVIFGEDGSDTLIGDNGNDSLDGGDGADTIYGGAGKDVIYGGAGADRIDGGWNSDELYGGSGPDVFVFQNRSNYDNLHDFDDGADLIDVVAWGFTSSADMTIAQVGSDTVITFDADDAVTLIGIASTSIDDSDFLFAGGSSPS